MRKVEKDKWDKEPCKCGCVCVCVRERERKREREIMTKKNIKYEWKKVTKTNKKWDKLSYVGLHEKFQYISTNYSMWPFSYIEHSQDEK